MKMAPTWILLGAAMAVLGAAPAQAQPAAPAPAPVAAPAPAPTPDPSADAGTNEGDAAAAASGELEDEADKPWSEGVAVDDRREARELFLEGNRLFRVPLFARAAAQYKAAIARWKHPAFYFNLSLAQINLGQEVDARDNLERALRYGAEPLGADEHLEAQKQLADLERQLGRIRISCQTQGAEVNLDGTTLFTAPGNYQTWIKAGPHELTAKKPGYLSEARKVNIKGGTRESVELRLITLEEVANRNRRWAVWKPWTVVVAGTAMAIGGGVFHSRSAKNFSSYDDDFLILPCANSTSGCTEEDIPSSLNDRLDRAELQQKLAIGSYIASGVLLTTGAILLYLNRPRTLEDQPSSTDRVSIRPELSLDSLGLVLSVSH